MSNIKEVKFYFANPQTNEEGQPIVSLPPETHTLTWQQVQENVGFSLSTGEAMFTELSIEEDDHIIKVVNGFYFGSGRYGSLLAIQYIYDDDSDGWIKEILHKHDTNSIHTDMLVGNWIKGLSYQEILAHEKWKGTPYIGLQDNYIEVKIERILPPLVPILDPIEKTIIKGESVTFTWSAKNYCDGDVTYTWEYNRSIIEQLSSPETEMILQFKQAGEHLITLHAENQCGQTGSAIATITVHEPEEIPCQLQLTPSNITIRLGETANFTAIHPYSERGVWTYDSSLNIVEKTEKTLKVTPNALGSYSISYSVGECQNHALLYVLQQIPDGEWEDPVEPEPPELPNTPPDKPGESGLIMDLFDVSRTIPQLYRYPNIVKTNSRYRGHRESEKFLNNHQEQIFEIRQIHKELERINTLEDETIQSWFHGIESKRNIMKLKDNAKDSAKNDVELSSTVESTRVAFQNDVVQLMSGSSFENRIIGINNIRERVQQIDERIAQAERRYRGYENAYE